MRGSLLRHTLLLATTTANATARATPPSPRVAAAFAVGPAIRSGRLRPSASITRRSFAASALRASEKEKMAEGDPPPVLPLPAGLCPDWFRPERARLLTPSAPLPRKGGGGGGGDDDDFVLYWMQRDVRAEDNWALLLAEHLARDLGVALRVCYVLPPPPPPPPASEALPPLAADLPMTERHGSFLLGGLRVAATDLASRGVPLYVIRPPAGRDGVGEAVSAHCAGRALAVVADFSPLRAPRDWIEGQAAPLLEAGGVPLYSVDAHNVVPVWHAAPKRQVGARTLRPRLNRLLPEFLTHYAEFGGNSHLGKAAAGGAPPPIPAIDWDGCEAYLELDGTVPPCPWAQPGGTAARKRLEEFCSAAAGGDGLRNFDKLRNDPNLPAVCSNLSPWINHGQVSFQRVALDVRALRRHPNGTAAFIEEGLVRRELSDNYVYYAPDDYDSLSGAAQWARDSLDLHESDEREYLYSLDELDRAETHDDLWNAAQMQLVGEGGMHGFLRMYWAKKILEWSPSAAVALRSGLHFNDRYALDGNDPNGFVGVAWSVMGVHDMGWKERPVFGKIRYMNYAGCKRKFKVDEFVAKYEGAKENAIAAAKKHGGPIQTKALASKKAGAPKKKKVVAKKAAPKKKKVVAKKVMSEKAALKAGLLAMAAGKKRKP